MAKRRIYYAEFRKTLEGAPLQPVYLLTGAEVYLKEEAIRAIVDKALDPAERQLNLEMLYAGTDVGGQELKERALTLPFFHSRRVLVVRQVEKWRAADLAALQDYLDRPAADAVLVLSSQEEKLTGGAWLAFAAKTYHVECYPLFDSQVPEWIERRARELGKRIQRAAVQRLIEQAGQSLSDLDHELVKLSQFTGGGETITEADVRAAAGHLRQDTLHDLNAALGRKDASQAVRLAARLLEEGANAPQVIGSLAWNFRRLYADRARLEAGEAADRILAGVRNPVQRRERLAQLNAFTGGEVPRIFKRLLKMDQQVKTGRPHWELALVLLILEVCANEGRGTAPGPKAGARRGT